MQYRKQLGAAAVTRPDPIGESLTPLEGIHTALVTPFDEDELIDETILRDLVEDQITHGVRGLVVNGSTGEFAALTPQERRRAVEVVVDASHGRAVITAQVGAMTTREAVEHAEHAQSAGADIGLLVSPYYEPLSEREIEVHVRAIADTGLPLMIYNNPGGVGWSMSVELITRLARMPEVQYLKDTTGDPRRIFDIAERADGALEILNGQDTLTLLGFLAGTGAAVWGAPNATPLACVRLWELAIRDADVDGALRLWREFYPVNRFFEHEGYVASVRAGAELRGLAVGAPRRPILPLSDAKLAELRDLMERVDRAVGAAAP